MIVPFLFFALWLAAIYVASSRALKRGNRRELWRSIMAALVGVAVHVKREK